MRASRSASWKRGARHRVHAVAADRDRRRGCERTDGCASAGARAGRKRARPRSGRGRIRLRSSQALGRTIEVRDDAADAACAGDARRAAAAPGCAAISGLRVEHDPSGPGRRAGAASDRAGLRAGSARQPDAVTWNSIDSNRSAAPRATRRQPESGRVRTPRFREKLDQRPGTRRIPNPPSDVPIGESATPARNGKRLAAVLAADPRRPPDRILGCWLADLVGVVACRRTASRRSRLGDLTPAS